MALGKPYRILCLNAPEKFSIILKHRNKEDALLFESFAVAQITGPEVQALRKLYTESLESYYGCLGVLQFHTEDDQLMFLVMIKGCVSVGKICDSEIFRVTETVFINLRGPSSEDDKIAEIKKVLNAGTFYFSWGGAAGQMDLTLCEQKRNLTKETDNRFFWNRTMFLHLLRFGIDCNEWLLRITCGSVEIKTVYAGAKNVKTAVVSRLSCERAGTRFNVRGTNDDGHVANFVETEQILTTESEMSSFLQTRGSVPLFWEQPGVQVGSHKVRLSRGPEAACSALAKHLHLLRERYGRQVIVNLLGTNMVGSKEGEAMLSSLFHSQHVNNPSFGDMPHILFDYHQEIRGNRGLEKLEIQIRKYLDQYGFYHNKTGKTERLQSGTIRTNCLDCLDRTNCVQTYIGVRTLESQLHAMGLIDKPQSQLRFEEVFRQMWVNNGNEVSKIYAGTGAIQGGSKLMDGARSVSRTIQNNLLDQSKQEAIDVLLLGHTFNTELTSYARSLLPAHYLHAPPSVLRQMVKRWEDYTKPKSLRVVIGTYNVNGGKHFRSVVYKDLSLSDWLLDAAKIARSSSLVSIEDEDVNTETPADIYAVGFQEMVDLNASNIIAASSENQKAWAEELGKILNRDNGYCLLSTLQLVGVCLYVFTRPELLPHIRDVATDSVKTGLGGATGNKGACAIRFVVYSTSVCFVCSHFAAGQNQAKERCNDYHEIKKNILFPMGRTLESHDYIFWCGDFNFRLDMDRDEVKDLIPRQEWPLLLKKDQLIQEKEKGNVFEGYEEGEIAFPPTYKYDLFSVDYDTSEKCRIPAWTDRVLWKRKMPLSDMTPPPDWSAGRCLHYGRAELKQSDHRPVVCVIEVEAFAVNEAKRDQVFAEVVRQLGPPDATIILRSDSSRVFDEEESDEIILNELSGCGNIILIRHIGDEVWITFKDGFSALAAVKLEYIQVGPYVVSVELKTKDWESHLDKEMAICVNNCIPLHPSQNNNTIKQNNSFTNLTVHHDEGLRRTLSDSKLGEGNKMKVPPRPMQPSQGGKPGHGPSVHGPSGHGPTRPPPPRSPMAERKVMNSDMMNRSPNESPMDSPKKMQLQFNTAGAPPIPNRISPPDSSPQEKSPVQQQQKVEPAVEQQQQEQQAPPPPKRISPGDSPKKEIPAVPPANAAGEIFESPKKQLQKQSSQTSSNSGSGHSTPPATGGGNFPPIPPRQVGTGTTTTQQPNLPPIPARNNPGAPPAIPARNPTIPPRR